MKRLALLLLGSSAVLLCTLTGCPPKPSATPTTGPVPGPASEPLVATGQEYEFALVPKLLNNPVFKLSEQGALAKAEELGGIKVIYQGPQTADTAKQVDLVDNLIRKGVDGIAISCNEAGALKGPIDRAVKAGIPTITFDSDSPDSERMAYYGIDNTKSGQKLGELLLEHLGEDAQGEVAILTGVLGAPNLEERIEGAKDVLAQKAPELTILPTVACDDDTQRGVTVVKDVLRSHPNLTGIIMVGGWPLFAKAPGPFEGHEPGKVACIAFDALPNEWDYVREGYVQALVAQRCFAWGYESIQILHDLATGGRPHAAFIDSGLDIVTAENVEEYAREWEEKVGG